MLCNKPQPCLPNGFMSNYEPTGDVEKMKYHMRWSVMKADMKEVIRRNT